MDLSASYLKLFLLFIVKTNVTQNVAKVIWKYSG
jgi:hypothetical protein